MKRRSQDWRPSLGLFRALEGSGQLGTGCIHLGTDPSSPASQPLHGSFGQAAVGDGTPVHRAWQPFTQDYENEKSLSKCSLHSTFPPHILTMCPQTLPHYYICDLRGKVFLAHEPLDEVFWRLKSLLHRNLYRHTIFAAN